MDAPAPLAIDLLGGFRVAVHGRAVPAEAWHQRRAAAIVKLLALAPGHRLHREQLIEALWPELDVDAASNNLRVALHRARRRLEQAGAAPDNVLVRDGEEVLLASSAALRVDVAVFAAAVARAWLSDDPADSRAALDGYTGELLPEDPYEDWAASPRAELHAAYVTLLARLAQLHERRGELGRAIATWQRLVSAEPLDENAHVALITLFARVGETRQATTQYERLVELLEHELDVAPRAATRELIAAVRAGSFPGEVEPLEAATVSPPLAEAPAEPPRPAVSGLPASLDDLIGREREMVELSHLLRGHRLLTLTGPAGVGKTRLALAAAHAASEGLHSAFFVDLTPLRDPQLVLPAIAHAAGVMEEGERPLRDAVIDRLNGEATLLVLDNFEQVAAAAAPVADLLAACANLRVVVTSRVRLRLRGEQEYPVQPLAVPESEDGRRKTEAGGRRTEEQVDPRPPPSSVLPPPSSYPAVALFARRASEADPAFSLTAEHVTPVVEMCRRLDGLPLAIELAAARVRILSPSALLARLEQPLALLTGGPRDAPPRQQTLRAAIAWSHDLLDEAEQTLFRRLAVFAGGFTLEAAEWVGSRRSEVGSTRQLVPPTSDLRLPTHVLDLVASLVEQSLLRRTDEGTTPRFTMLATIRDFAAEQLAAAGERAAVAASHAAFYLDLAERAAPELNGPAATTWLNALQSEHDNLRAALATLHERADALTHLRLVGALWRFWLLHGHLSEGRALLERALADGAAVSADVRARALGGAGALAAAQGDLAQAAARHGEALSLWRAAGDRREVASALTRLGLTADEQGDPRLAATYLQEALAIARMAGDQRGLAVVLANLGQVAMTLQEHQRAAALLGESAAFFRAFGDERSQAAILANLGIVALMTGDFSRAQTCHEEALSLLCGLGDRQGEADVLLNLGHTRQRLGDLERAGSHFAEALDRFTELGDRSGVAFAQVHLGRLALLLGNREGAQTLLAQGLALAQEIGDRVAVAEALEGLAAVACAGDDALQGAHLIGAAEALREATGVPLPDVLRADYQQVLGEARRALGEAAFVAARAEGQRLALAEIGDPPLAILALSLTPGPSPMEPNLG